MKAWLIYEEEGATRNRDYIDMHIEKGKRFGMEFRVIICDKEKLPSTLPDFAIVRAMRPDITKKIEDIGVPVFNSYHVSSICNNKARTYEYLKENGIPVMPWVSAKSTDAPIEVPYFPAVIKPCSGHGGENVSIIRNEEEYLASLRRIYPDEYVIQPIATGVGRDMRVYVVGNKICGAVQRTSKNDFRSNFSLGGEVEKAELTQDEKKLADAVISLFDFGMCGIDIMYHEEKPVINEIEDVVGSRMLYKTHDIDILDIYLSYIKERMNS